MVWHDCIMAVWCSVIRGVYGSEKYDVVRWRSPLLDSAATESSIHGKRRRNKTAQVKAENKKYQNERGIFT